MKAKTKKQLTIDLVAAGVNPIPSSSLADLQAMAAEKGIPTDEEDDADDNEPDPPEPEVIPSPPGEDSGSRLITPQMACAGLTQSADGQA